MYFREKYFKGINYGLVGEERTMPLTIQEKTALGNSYLFQIKELNQHRKNKTVDYSSINTSRMMSESQKLK